MLIVLKMVTKDGHITWKQMLLLSNDLQLQDKLTEEV